MGTLAPQFCEILKVCFHTDLEKNNNYLAMSKVMSAFLDECGHFSKADGEME